MDLCSPNEIYLVVGNPIVDNPFFSIEKEVTESHKQFIWITMDVNSKLFSLLEKEAIALNIKNGFSFVEVLISTSLALMLLTLILPIYNSVEQERKILSIREDTAIELSQLTLSYITGLKKIHPDDLPLELETASLTNTKITIKEHTEDLFSLCGNWKNLKKREEKLCFYGVYPD